MGTSRERFISARGIAGSFLIFLLIINLFFGAFAFVFADSKGVVNTEDGLNIRKGAGTDYPIVEVLPHNEAVTVTGESTDSEGVKWYKITSKYGDGYVCSYYITLEKSESESSSETSSGYDVAYSTDEDFEAYLDAQGFPESYKPYLRSLHAEHPNWRFIAMHTGLDWQEVIYRETHPVSTSLVPNSWSDSWQSRDPASYDAETGEYYIFDSGGYVAANDYAVAYYMDPRNNMGSETIFQFLSNKFDESTQTIEGIQTIVKGTYLETRDPGEEFNTYAELIYSVGKEMGVNPLTIASMLILEQGRSGGSDLISGVCEDHEGYYNFFNIGAYAAGGRSAVDNGLIYAQNKGWDSPYKAIKGGSEIYANNYVYNNKSTLYFQKFNVLNGMTKVGTGQYMTAIYAASSEGRIMSEGYQESDGGISFEIPTYENMPEDPSPLPTTIDIPPRELPKKKTSTESGDDKDKSDDKDKTEDDKDADKEKTESDNKTTTDNDADNEKTKGDDKAKTDNNEKPEEDEKPEGGDKPEGDDNPEGNDNEKSESDDSEKSESNNKAEDKKEDPAETTPPTPAEPTATSEQYTLGENITGVSAETTASALLENMTIENGSSKIFDASGNEIASDSLASTNIGTGATLKVYDSEGTEKLSYTVIIRGDNNSDGKVNSADALRAQRHSIGTLTLSGPALMASDINGDGKHNSADALLMQRFSIGTYAISW